MDETPADYRKYLDPRTLARVSGLDLRARLVVEGLTGGMHRSPFQGISVEFAQHRPYVQGDDVRHIDWKVYGRSDKIYLKQYQEETNLHLIPIVDASESMGFGTVAARSAAEAGQTDAGSGGVLGGGMLKSGEVIWTKFDHATAIAASLAYMAIRQQDSVGLAVFDQGIQKYLKPSNAPGQWKTIAGELSQTPKRGKTGIGKVLAQVGEKLNHRSLIVLISDFFDDPESIARGLRQLRFKRHEVIVLQVLDPAEIVFPFEDVTLFKGLEESGELLTEPRALREAYCGQVEAHTARLKRLCQGMKIDFARFDSGESLEVALSGFVANRAASMR